MKSKLSHLSLLNVILRVVLLLFISQNPILACSCFSYEPVFCRNVNERHNIVRGVVKEHQDYSLMQISVIENINKEISEDTIIILGQDGVNCGESLDQFSINDTLILALLKWEVDEMDYWYLDGACGLHFLRYRDGMVYGQIGDTLTNLSLQGFKEDLFSCLDMQVPTKKIETDEFQFMLSPNPVPNIFQVSTLIPQIMAYEVYNSSGVKIETRVFKQRMEQIEINAKGFEKGIYYIRIRTPNGNLTRKFLKT